MTAELGSRQRQLLDVTWNRGCGLYLGAGPRDLVFAPPQHGLLVLGPPRCGKTASVVVPNVLAACGPVVSTSTKPDVLQATSLARRSLGRCYMFDPSGTASPPDWVTPIAWSPLLASQDWDRACAMAKAMVLAARPGSDRGEAAFWSDRAEELLAIAFHSGASQGLAFETVVGWIDERNLRGMRAPLAEASRKAALSKLQGFEATDHREQSGVWSTASTVLAGYRTSTAMATTTGEMLDPAAFVRGSSTLYICAGSDEQRLSASLVAGVLNDLKTAAYALRRDGGSGPPMLLALDEVANIAPLHDLPSLAAEGGSQGVVTLTCFQDLSQAAGRWPHDWRGFLTTFQQKLIFPGIGDTDTLERISRLAGDTDVPHSSTTRASPWATVLGDRSAPSRTDTTRRERRLPLDEIARGGDGCMLWLEGVEHAWLRTTPWYQHEMFRSVAWEGVNRWSPAREAGLDGHERGNERGTGRPGRAP